MWLLIAQSVADPISGGAGWVGAGLLGAVLSWLLLKHLPEKDRQQKEMNDSHRLHTKERDATYAETIKEINAHHERVIEQIRAHHEHVLSQSRDDFTRYLNRIIEHCQSEMASVTRFIEKDLQSLSASMAKIDLRNADLDDLENQVLELRKKLQEQATKK